MSDDSIEVEEGATGGFSRRNALKAGVAAGVGITAWSGATITSLGGTPAFAAGCTGVIEIDLSGCRNTDQGNSANCTLSGSYGYHPLKTALPPTYSITNNIGEHTCCELNSEVTFNFPPAQKCTVFLELWNTGISSCVQRNDLIGSHLLGAGTTGSLQIHLPCFPDVGGGDKYSITAFCANDSAPNECLEHPIEETS